MKKWLTAMAVVAVAFLALAPMAAVAQHAIDPGVVHAGASSVDLTSPSTEPARFFETRATLTADSFTPDGQVPVPYGSWLDKLLAFFATGIAAWITLTFKTWAEAKIGRDAAAALSGFTEQAINYGINATRDAVRDKTLSIEVGNEVLERALEYGLRLFPGLIEQFGGAEAQRQRIMARLNLEAKAAIPVPRPPSTTFAAATPERPPLANAE